MHERLQIIRNGLSRSVSFQGLRHGADGNVQTLQIAAGWLREDAGDDGLRREALGLIAECEPHDTQCEISKLFEFVRDGIRYVDDPRGVERLADARETMRVKQGDCLDKAVLLMTLLAAIGIRSRFIVQDWDNDVALNGFDHVHPEIVFDDGSTLQADPTERSGILGWEKPGAGRMMFEVWESGQQVPVGLDMSGGLSGFMDDFGGQLIGAGIQLGTQYGTQALQQSRITSAQETQVANAFNQLVAEAVRVLQAISAKLPNITADDYNVAQQYYGAIENFVARYPTETVTQLWNDPNYKAAFIHDLQLYQAALNSNARGQTSGNGSVLPGGAAPAGTNVWLIAAVAIALLVLVKR